MDENDFWTIVEETRARLGGDDGEALADALTDRLAAEPPEVDMRAELDDEPAGGRNPSADPAGEDFDFDDDDEMRRRLPRLAALFLTD